MRTNRSTFIGDRRRSSRLVAWLVLLAFTLQCYATQIHIHGPASSAPGTSIGRIADEAGHRGKSPGTPGPADCPICQAIAHSGLFFTPAAPLLSLPAWVAHIAPPELGHSISRIAATHDWLSRAPPPN